MAKDTAKSGGPSIRTQDMTLIAVMTALMCVLGPLTIPIGPVPVAPVIAVLFITVYLLGTQRAVISTLLYLLIGLVGVPVFSSFTAGPAKLFGPTGGYLVGYIPMILICGMLLDRCRGHLVPEFLSMFVSLVFLYLMGTIWLMLFSNMTFMAALAVGVLPFIAIDIGKIIAALFLGRVLRRRVPMLRRTQP